MGQKEWNRRCGSPGGSPSKTTRRAGPARPARGGQAYRGVRGMGRRKKSKIAKRTQVLEGWKFCKEPMVNGLQKSDVGECRKTLRSSIENEPKFERGQVAGVTPHLDPLPPRHNQRPLRPRILRGRVSAASAAFGSVRLDSPQGARRQEWGRG